jgi:hypothetical protein
MKQRMRLSRHVWFSVPGYEIMAACIFQEVGQVGGV